jgi:putative ABC transport system permease protein
MSFGAAAFAHGIPHAPVPLAWRNLMADKRRLGRSAAGIGFAVLLMLAQLGFYHAFIDSALNLARLLDADIVMISATKYSISWPDQFPLQRLQQALAVPGVASAYPLHILDERSWRNESAGTLRPIEVIAFDPDKPVFLSDEINAARAALKQPGTALMDRRSRAFLGPSRTGLETEVGRRHIRLVGTFSLGPDFAADGRLIMSDRNMLSFFPPPGGPVPRLTRGDYGAIKLRPGADPAAVLAGLRAELPADVAVYAKADYLEREKQYQMKINPVGPIFGLGIFIGFVVGILIAYQILYTDLSDQLPQYATLKAMGYGRRPLIRTVLIQAVLLGLAGYLPAVLVAAGFYFMVSEVTLLPMDLSPGVLAFAFCLSVGMCLLSALLAVRRVLAADPAELF